ncbi:MAG: hypothetical protein OEY55_07645 [Acidimicrobiia bacterium]|nr:hypothetical protein [Acidimicrobiia bacterium]
MRRQPVPRVHRPSRRWGGYGRRSRYVNITDDGIHYSTFVAIAPGQHRVRLALDNRDDTIVSFDGNLDFEPVDRCHDTDSQATIEANQVTVER